MATEYIPREEVEDIILNCPDKISMLKRVKKLPILTINEAYWISADYSKPFDSKLNIKYRCSNCNCIEHTRLPICPKCGAQMGG